ncbi:MULTISPECIES: precorrin-2 C(20)-methyltransferase [Sorangium]|uniref:Precorrin-2 C20-methyltransferase n=1 Tax=Sorangium cellulosum TaxID=56 RepID=A0A4P2QFX5_SORCE|nr:MULTISPECIES: precorrin-2 C(20)-methyltransferase [Sorangium]AUX28416.1 precorrin-2 C20-methyltransferase [Sorangium cellulosum]WCQ87808.1 Cobalt-precorrin-2 C(20)-methyltransferase [Sorangium sp. Soce836]
MSGLGKLYGVGVGPGAPDLLTLRAVRVLEGADVLALPRSSDFGASMAYRILEPVVGKQRDKERLLLTFPMSKDPDRVRPYVDAAVDKIGDRLSRGLSVAFATEGDPSLFSTFVYVRREALRRFPGLEVEVVPGVTSVTAVPAVSGLALADGQERIAILPATYGVDDLTDVLRRFDTVVLMKIGSEMPKVTEALTRAGLLDRAVFVSKATMPEQRIVRDLRAAQGERGDCFAMVVVTRGERSGLLVGEAEASLPGSFGDSLNEEPEAP